MFLKIIYFILFQLAFLFCFPQQNSPFAVTSGSAYSGSADFIHEFSIGDMSAVETFTSPSVILTQGFLQPDFEIETIVVDDNCLIPNGISPNDDGVNDTWFIPCLSIYPKSKVRIFNRWGQQIYEGTGNESPWNGTYRGENLPMADYYFIISIEELDKKITGTITLKR
jgi:gliding motility-associated-like protein